MALPSSGQITLNQMHVEASGNSGTQSNINSAPIRALITKSASVQMAFTEWYGASAAPVLPPTHSSVRSNYNVNELPICIVSKSLFNRWVMQIQI